MDDADKIIDAGPAKLVFPCIILLVLNRRADPESE
jgi:hypothetical protein